MQCKHTRVQLVYISQDSIFSKTFEWISYFWTATTAAKEKFCWTYCSLSYRYADIHLMYAWDSMHSILRVNNHSWMRCIRLEIDWQRNAFKMFLFLLFEICASELLVYYVRNYCCYQVDKNSMRWKVHNDEWKWNLKICVGQDEWT